MARLYSPSAEHISLLGKALLGGELVAVPTETVYGLAAHAFDAGACAEIFRAKGRPAFDPLIVHLPIGYDLREVAHPNPLARKLADRFWPGALTLVLPKQPKIPDIVTSGFDSVAVRVSGHAVFQELLRACGVPLAAPSANPFGYVSPTTAAHVEAGLGGRINHILDGGPCEIGVESTILDVRDEGRPVLLRPGGIPREELEKVIGLPLADAPSPTGQIMPGQLDRHYSPDAPCSLSEKLDPAAAVGRPRDAFLFYRRPTQATGENVFWLTESGDDREAARNLFRVLREMDRLRFASIYAERVPAHGLGLAINDRLRRAAAR